MPLPSPSWNWSTDFTTLHGLDFCELSTLPAIADTFFNAWNEKLNAIGLIVTPVPSTDSIGTFNQALLWFAAMQGSIEEFGTTYFVRQTDPSGSPWTPDGSVGILDQRYSNYDNTAFVEDRKFPYPNGWSRTLPRTIYSSAQTGTDGMRARLQNIQGDLYYQTLSTDPLYQTYVTTPTDDEKNSGKYFDYSGGAWTLSSDQLSDADLLVEYEVLIQPGDYLTTQLLNDLRDAVNQCTRTSCTDGSLHPCEFNSNGYFTNVFSFANNVLTQVVTETIIGESGYMYLTEPTGSNPLGQKRAIQFYTANATPGATWTAIGSPTTPTADDDVVGPGWPSFTGNAAAVLDWGVTDGFVYVAGYTGT